MQGENIKKLRTSRNLSIEKFSEIVGITVNTVIKYESGIRKPTIREINKIIKSLNIPIEEIIDKSSLDLKNWNISNTIKKYRIAAGITQGELALNTNIPLSSISNYERGNKILPKAIEISKICKRLNIPTSELRTQIEIDNPIKNQRITAGLTQKKLPKKTGILTNKINNIEKSIKDSKVTEISNKSKRLNIPVSELPTQIEIDNPIKKHRKAAGLTQKELSTKTGIAMSQISNFENNIKDPKLTEIYKLCEILKIPMEQIVDKITNQPISEKTNQPISEIVDKPTQINIGKNIESYRIIKRLTQKELSEKTGIPISGISNYESGIKEPRAKELNKITKCLDIPIENIIGNKTFDISNNIKKYRTIAGLTQKELAEKANLSISSISKYERGIREPGMIEMNKILKHFNIDTAELEEEPSLTSIGKNIKKYRRRKCLTRKELATIVGVSLVTIKNYENDERNPNLKLLKKIAISLGITFRELFENTEFDLNENETGKEKYLLTLKSIKKVIEEILPE